MLLRQHILRGAVGVIIYDINTRYYRYGILTSIWWNLTHKNSWNCSPKVTTITGDFWDSSRCQSARSGRAELRCVCHPSVARELAPCWAKRPAISCGKRSRFHGQVPWDEWDMISYGHPSNGNPCDRMDSGGWGWPPLNMRPWTAPFWGRWHIQCRAYPISLFEAPRLLCCLVNLPNKSWNGRPAAVLLLNFQTHFYRCWNL